MYQSQGIILDSFEYSFQQDRLIRVSNDKEEVVISKQELISHPVLQKNKSLVDYLQNSQFVISNLQFSHDHRFIAVCFPTELSEGLIVKDMSTGMTGFYVENIDNYVVFDNLYGLFYVEKDQETGKGRKVWRKDFGKEKTEDEKVLEETRINIAGKPSVYAELVYEEPDPNFSVEVSQSLSKEYVFIKSDNLSYDPFLISTEFRFRASNKTQGDFLIIQERKEGQNYDVKHQGQYFYLLVSTPEEYNGKVLILDIPPLSSYYPPDGPVIFAETKELQHEFLGAKVFRPHNSQVYIEHVEAFKDHLVSILIDTDNSMQHIQVDNFLNESTDIVAYDKYEGSLKVANNKSYRIKLDQTDQEFYGQSFNYILSTLHCPDQKISYDLKTRMNKVLSYSYEVPEVRIQDYTSERIVLPANDGELIPVTLIYNKRNVATGDKAAAIVESYGGEVENSHNFKLNPFWYSVLDRGFLWVIPHVRGSHDITRTWYDRGSGTNKIRHLQDLLDTIVSLYSEKIVSSASGYSTTPSGGLSFAALMQKEPELLSCAVLRVIST